MRLFAGGSLPGRNRPRYGSSYNMRMQTEIQKAIPIHQACRSMLESTGLSSQETHSNIRR